VARTASTLHIAPGATDFGSRRIHRRERLRISGSGKRANAAGIGFAVSHLELVCEFVGAGCHARGEEKMVADEARLKSIVESKAEVR